MLAKVTAVVSIFLGGNSPNFNTILEPLRISSHLGPLTWADPSTSKVKLVGVVSWGIGKHFPILKFLTYNKDT